MSSITIRNLDPAIKERLRVRAARHGHSMAAEARRILQTACVETPDRPPGRNLYDRIRARFAPLGGIELQLPPREPARFE
ncbi:MAG TPA: plasmid stabilization protein [Rhodopila sp.]|nr:plasmid stabilization protein [Rhodopila sp.]